MFRPLLAHLLVWSCLAGVVAGMVRTIRMPAEDSVLAVARPRDVPKDTVARLSLDLPPREAFAEVTARPIFSPTRRPPEIPVARSSQRAFPEITLMGVAGRTKSLQAIIAHVDEGVVRAEEGAEIDGWVIRGITTGSVELVPAGGGDAVLIVLGDAAAGDGPLAPRAEPERGSVLGGLGYDG